MNILESTSICGTILDTLGGGRRLQTLCGTGRIVADEEAGRVTFGVKKTHIVRITRDEANDFTVEYLRQNAFKEYATTGLLYKTVRRFEGVALEDLPEYFTRATGLDLHL